MIDYKKISENEEVIELLKKRDKLEAEIYALDENALINYALEKLQEDDNS